MQLAIDQAALKGDLQLLTTLAIGFGLFGLFNLGASVLRQWATQHLSVILSWDMSLRLFRHLVRLPLPWFQRRRLADTISRFDAINPIRDLVSGALISTIIDGLLAITTLVMMVVFSWWLALLTLLGIGLYIGVRLLTLSTELRLGAESLMAHIGENGKRIETIKAIQTVKTMSAETAQETQWSNSYAESLKKDLNAARFHIATGSIHQAFDVIISTLLIYFGAKAIIETKMTVGILYAFMAYKGQFSNAVIQIVEKLIQWKLSDIYSYRLADIVLQPREEGIDRPSPQTPELKGDIEIDNLHFRYGPHEPSIIKGLSLTIKAGEMIAIIGPSGAGKSTLLKLMCGLYTPTFGEIRIDDRTLSQWGPRPLRQAFGIVMQDDELLSGTVADNVAFFDDHIDMDQVWWALEAAALKEEILSMPMKAESFVGDMGGALSGGQKQRLLLARCLYKKPRLVFLDEATSHLDAANEAIINTALKAMNITRVIIAHRQETIAAADRVFDLSSGQFVKGLELT
jgi:ATP-binding cassette subfamily B protein RaxB